MQNPSAPTVCEYTGCDAPARIKVIGSSLKGTAWSHVCMSHVTVTVCTLTIHLALRRWTGTAIDLYSSTS